MTEETAAVPPPPGKPTPLERWRATPFWVVCERYFVAHTLAWPLGFIAAVMAMPWVLMIHGEEILRTGDQGARYEIFQGIAAEQGLDGTTAAAMETMTIYMLWAGAIAMVVPHIAGVPWAMVQAKRSASKEEKKRSTKQFFVVNALAFALIGAAGIGGYVWFFISVGS